MTINSVPLRMIIKMRARLYAVSNSDYEIVEVCFINIIHDYHLYAEIMYAIRKIMI